MATRHAIVHYLDKPQDGPANLSPRGTELQLDDRLETLISQVNATYNGRSGKIHGWFEGDRQTYPFSRWLDEYRQEKRDFVSVTSELLNRFAQQLQEVADPLSGYLLCTHIRGERDQFLILLLSTSSALTIDDRLELSDSRQLEPGKVQLGARIELDQWREGDDSQYLSFIRARSAREVSEAFRSALGCTEVADSKEQTSALLQVFQDYCHEAQLPQKQVSEVKQRAYEYCSDQVESGERVRIRELSGVMDSNDPDKFFNYVTEQETPLQQEIAPDKRGLTRFVRYSGSMKGLSLSFSEMLLGDQVIYDPASDTITIRGLPPTLRKQLERNKS